MKWHHDLPLNYQNIGKYMVLVRLESVSRSLYTTYNFRISYAILCVYTVNIYTQKSNYSKSARIQLYPAPVLGHENVLEHAACPASISLVDYRSSIVQIINQEFNSWKPKPYMIPSSILIAFCIMRLWVPYTMSEGVEISFTPITSNMSHTQKRFGARGLRHNRHKVIQPSVSCAGTKLNP